MSTIGGAETFQLTIRCAMQSFPDHNLDCPAEWSVLQLKKHLAEECVTKPDPSRQRLIYAGHCLNNEQKVRDVLAQRRDAIIRNEVAEKQPTQVIHMVYIGGQSSTTTNSGTTSSQNNNTAAPTPAVNATSEGLRHRGTNGQQNSSSSTTPVVPSRPEQQQQQPYAFMPPQQYYLGALQQQHQQQSYEAWMSAYQNYMNQMAHLYNQQPPTPYGPNNAVASAAQMAQQQAYAYYGASMPTAQQQQQQLVHMAPHFNMAQQQQQAQQQHQHMMMMMAVPHQHEQQQRAAGDAPAAVAEHQQQQRMVGAGVAEAVRGGAAAVQADLLDIVYKSVRFALLAMVLYIYSSLERFFLVLAVVAFFWFVHRRRNQQQRDNNAAAVPENANPLQHQQNVDQDNNNDMPNDRLADDGQPPAEAVQQANINSVPQQPSAWNVFFTVVQSFFTSLVPNPMPAAMDIN